jgi:hypothetical protein
MYTSDERGLEAGELASFGGGSDGHEEERL